MIHFWCGFNKQAEELEEVFPDWNEDSIEAEAKAKKLSERDTSVSPTDFQFNEVFEFNS